MGKIPSHILQHVAVPVSYETEPDPSTEWAEGEPGVGPEPVNGNPFVCVLFLPSPGGDQPNPYRPRAVRSPTLMCNPTRDFALADPAFPVVQADHSPIVFGKEDELLVTAPELAAWTGGETVRWQVDGVPQPFGPPGQVIGILATLRQVLD